MRKTLMLRMNNPQSLLKTAPSNGMNKRKANKRSYSQRIYTLQVHLANRISLMLTIAVMPL
jgi:hypothetical protein